MSRELKDIVAELNLTAIYEEAERRLSQDVKVTLGRLTLHAACYG
ncbi:MAG TPA: hypothetical protein VKB12_02470 [Pyrinomonadaceae bacterium]|nr:hypothetical protein [Pyrinomonadaceae bacterium]